MSESIVDFGVEALRDNMIEAGVTPERTNTLLEITRRGDYRETLLAMRDRLAEEADDTRWAQHKRECECVCGLGDGRTLIAVIKELRVLLVLIDALPDANRKSRSEEIAAKRARRLAAVPDLAS